MSDQQRSRSRENMFDESKANQHMNMTNAFEKPRRSEAFDLTPHKAPEIQNIDLLADDTKSNLEDVLKQQSSKRRSRGHARAKSTVRNTNQSTLIKPASKRKQDRRDNASQDDIVSNAEREKNDFDTGLPEIPAVQQS